MRGWTAEPRLDLQGQPVFPAHAGMDRNPSPSAFQSPRFPRACGDGPGARLSLHRPAKVFPAHAGMDRRSDPFHGSVQAVFPAHAGMDRFRPRKMRGLQLFSPRMRGWTGFMRDRRKRRVGFPRACGDGPVILPPQLPQQHGFSPRMRGWTGLPYLDVGLVAFSPRMRGWTALPPRGRSRPARFPRACGDGPVVTLHKDHDYVSFPRACGDGPLLMHLLRRKRHVFPAHAGMDRSCRQKMTWGLLVFPAHAGMDRLLARPHRACAVFSPRMRGWTAA